MQKTTSKRYMSYALLSSNTLTIVYFIIFYVKISRLTEQKISVPSKSIAVAKNGPAENAGSKLRRFNKNGVQLPKLTETNTMLAREMLTTMLCTNEPVA